MRITGVTRAALLNALRQSNYWWAGDMEEEEFLSRLIDLDAHPSHDERFKTFREDLWQHRINNPGDWESEWVFNDPRVGLDDDGALLRFLAETLHPEVRTDTTEVEALAGFYNHHLRPDGIELYVRSRISGRPVYAPRLAVAPAPTSKEFRDGIASCIASFSANDVADTCVRLGLAGPENKSDTPWSSKFKYASRRLAGKSVDELLPVARSLVDETDDEQLAELIAAVEPPVGGVEGAAKYLIFAAGDVKPEIVLPDAINMEIRITKHADKCLVYDRPVGDSGLSWRELVHWWTDLTDQTDEVAAATSLYDRLRSSVQKSNSPPEEILFRAYGHLYNDVGPDLPALIPQVYLHLDPRTAKTAGDAFTRQRMDFLLLLPRRHRVVIEVDGQHHYSINGQPSPPRYAAMMSADRELRLKGYEVYRFGGSEFAAPDARLMLTNFFHRLLGAHGIEI